MKIICGILLLILTLTGCGRKTDVIDAEPLFTRTEEPAKFQKYVQEFLIGNGTIIPTDNKILTTCLPPNPEIAYKSEPNPVCDYMKNMPINFYDLDSKPSYKNFAAVCVKSSKTGRREILIDINDWAGYKNDEDKTRRALVLHELGHCNRSLNREHFNIPSDFSKRSIMEACLIFGTDFFDNETYLKKELFGKLNGTEARPQLKWYSKLNIMGQCSGPDPVPPPTGTSK